MIDRPFLPTTKRFPVPRGGTLRSEDVGQFVESVSQDMVDASVTISALSRRLEDLAASMRLEREELRQRIAGLEKELEAERLVDSVSASKVVVGLSLHDPRRISHLSGAALASRASVDTAFGVATVPLNAVEHRFLVENLRTGAVEAVEDLVVSVSSTFDAGSGVVDHEAGALNVDEGTPAWAFNGNDTKAWMRRVEFPLESDVTEVLCEITATLPAQANTQANIAYIVPFPAGLTDIVGVWVAPDLGDSFNLVPGFSELRGAQATKWLFVPQQVQRLKVRLRQRNWVEERGRKVFYLGAQEIGLQLADFDKTYDAAGELTENHSFVLQATAPEGYEYDGLSRLYTDPMFDLEDPGTRHVHIVACRVGDGSDVVWDSDSDALPQTTPVSFTAVKTLYFIVTLAFASSSGGVSSPFPVGTSAYLRGLSFEADVVAES